VAVKVLDSWALIAFFEDEPAAEPVENLLVKAEAGVHQLLLCVVNWGEIYYTTMREISQDAAEEQARELAGLPIELVGVGESNLDLVRKAAVYKATRKLSYADAFAAALAKIRNAQLVTGDREFREVEDDIDIEWLIRPLKRP
jgi:predicted nucleic acid-binding protein